MVQNKFIIDSKGRRTPKIEGWKVLTFNVDGAPLWSYTSETTPSPEWPITSVVAVDLNGDGREEVMLESSSGVKALDAAGKLLQPPSKLKTSAKLGFGDLMGDTGAEFVCCNPKGKLQVSDLEGKNVREIATSFHANSACVWKPRKAASENKGMIVASGWFTDKPIRGAHSMIAAFDYIGNVQWSFETQGFTRMNEVFTCPSRPWIAVKNSRRILVIDMIAGKEIASINLQGYFRDLAWITTNDGDALLVVNRSDKIDAYRVKGESPN